MSKARPGPPRVGVISESCEQRTALAELLAANGLEVALARPLSEYPSLDLPGARLDILLVDIDESAEEMLDGCLIALEELHLPVFFSDSGLHQVAGARERAARGRRLAEKLKGIVRCAPEPAREPPRTTEHSAPPVPEARARRIWVLGASIGGPQALKRFLAALPAELPAAFLIAQHLGDGFIDLFSDQLRRATGLTVRCATGGETLEPGTVLVAPTDAELGFDSLRRVALAPLREGPHPYTPCIDRVISQVARSFGGEAGAILFSGMGEDGVRGCEALAHAGGEVWAQDAASCVVSNMPDVLRRTGLARASGEPEALARRLHGRLMGGAPPHGSPAAGAQVAQAGERS
ncbi:MAG: chemotaxis protein CheB [Gammaproteobacteria bacterium]|nr:chemotaxis protein CheB [Gammaproteobacteria bacterium]NIR60553.1 chemotaxis protein CheB [Gammaproteobacteria bacterium]